MGGEVDAERVANGNGFRQGRHPVEGDRAVRRDFDRERFGGPSE